MLFHLKARRGLSNVVTAAIMLTFVAVLGTGLVTWSNTDLRTFETSLVNSTGTTINKISESLAFENVQFCNQLSSYCYTQASKLLNVTVTNIGTEGITITKLQVNGTDFSSKTQYGSSKLQLSTNPFKLAPGSSASFVVTTTNQWRAYDQSTITIISSRGSTFTTQAVAP